MSDFDRSPESTAKWKSYHDTLLANAADYEEWANEGKRVEEYTKHAVSNREHARWIEERWL